MLTSPKPTRLTMLLLCALLVAACGTGSAGSGAGTSNGGATKKPAVARTSSTAGTASAPPGSHAAVPVTLTRVHVQVIGHLPAAIDKTAAVVLGDGRLLVAGGLVNGASNASIWAGPPGAGMRVIGKLPQPLHDAAAARVGNTVLHIGGGATAQFDAIRVVDQATGTVRVTGHLPRPASDLGVAVIGDAAYAVGGYDGATWLDTVIRIDAGGAAPRVIAHLPIGLRYAAVGSIGGKLYVAGGTRSSGADSAAVFRINIDTGKVDRLADLRHTTAHAVFVVVGGNLVLAGGRSGTPGAHELLAFDAASGVTHSIGHLLLGIADPGAVSLPDGSALLVGGSTAAGTPTDTITQLRS